MTTTATWRLTETEARALSAGIADDPELALDAVDLHEEAPGTWAVIAYLGQPSGQTRAKLRAMAVQIVGKAADPEWRALPDTDWVRRSQEALPPVRAGRILVYGQHDRDAVRPNDIAIRIEAGQAFGTGHHATTRGCLLGIQTVVKSREIRSALDIGTGSGVLAIALARLGVRSIVGTDIDPIAVWIARENARANRALQSIDVRVADPLQRARLPAGPAGPYDLIVANILLAPLLALAPAISRAIAPGGTVILSGLLPDQRIPIVATYRSVGLRLRRWFVHDGWLVVVLERALRGRAALR